MFKDPNIQAELKELHSILATVSNTNVYTVPAGYFDAMLQDILHAIDRQPQPVHANSTVPEGYFEGLAGSILDKIKNGQPMEDEDSAFLSPLKNNPVYTVPDSYFNGLADEVINKIYAAEGIREESSLLEPLKNINPYSLPQGYFDTLAVSINSKISKPAPVFIMKKRSSFFNYAAAAVITGILGLSVISVVDKRNTSESLPVVAEMNLNFDEALSNVSDDDIVAYLKESGEDVNAALVASATDSKNLPDELDYITNDNTLDNLLNDLNIKDQSVNN